MDWIAGLDCWTGLMDQIAGLNLFTSHDFHTIKCCKFGYSIDYLAIQSLPYYKRHLSTACLGMYMSAQCTNYMDEYASWIHGVHTVSSKHQQAEKSIKGTDKGLFAKNNALPECDREHWCQMLYWLVVTRLCNTS